MPAKQQNRTQIITELFELLPQCDGFQHTTEELHQFFDNLVSQGLIKKLRKETDKSESDGPKEKTKPLTAYNMFMKENPKWPGSTMKERSDARTLAWNTLKMSESDKLQELEDKAEAYNKEHNLVRKPKADKPLSFAAQQAERMKELEKRLAAQGCDISDVHIPVKPPRKSNPSSAQPSPLYASNDLAKAQDLISQEIEKLSISSPPMSPRADEESIDSPEQDRAQWIKSLGLKHNLCSHFKAWIMYNDDENYGPDLEDQISNISLSDLKDEWDYENMKKDPSAPWHKFLENL